MKAAALLLLALALQTWASPIRQPAEIPSTGDIGKDVEDREVERDRRTSTESYSVEEVMAEATCVARAGDLGLVEGWVYAVERLCSGRDTCTGICTSRFLHVQDTQSVHHTWRAFAALHIYRGRPNTSPSTRSDPHIGLKVYYYRNVDNTGCGPNFCCCFAN